MQIRITPIETSSGEIIDAMQGAGVIFPESQILRFDLAWEMYFGREYTYRDGRQYLQLPAGNPRTTSRMLLRWMKSVCVNFLNIVDRNLNREQDPLLVLLPPCTPEVRELIYRHLSFYTEDLKGIEVWDGIRDPFLEAGTDVWIPPVVQTANPTELLRHQSKQNEGEQTYIFQTVLGIENVYMQKYTLQPGAVNSRLHTHSDVDEIYLVLEGTCTFQIGSRDVIVRQGDFVTKPKGIGLATQVYNHSEQLVTILDFEIWGDPEGTDLAFYPDHAEVLVRGRGFIHGVPLDAFDLEEDLQKFYDAGYRRQRDGSVVPKEMRGVPVRETE